MSEPTGDASIPPVTETTGDATTPMEWRPPTTPPAGWYPDPAGGTQLRWWDGSTWIDGTGTVPAPVPRSHRGMVVAILVVALVLVGGAVGAVAYVHHRNTTPVASTVAVNGGTRVSGRGVSLTIPRGWTNVPLSKDGFARFLDTVASKDPQDAQQLTAQVRAAVSQSAVMLAIDSPDISQGFHSNALLEVVPVDTSRHTAAEYEAEAKRELQGVGVSDVVTRQTNIGGYPVVVATYDQQRTLGLVHGTEYLVLGPGKLAVLAVTGLTDMTGVGQQMAETISFA